MSTKFPGQEHLFDDDEEEDTLAPVVEAPKPKRSIFCGDPTAFISLATRIPGLRMTPCDAKIPVEKGWNGADYWQKNADMVKAVMEWCVEYVKPNFAFCLGPKCGPRGDLVLEADNQAGEDWLAANVPATPIATVTRHGFLHRHYQPDPPDPESGFSRGNITDLFGSKKRHTQMATAAGYDVIIERDRKNEPEYLAYIAGERERALRDIPMGPIVDLKCAGGMAMVPGSVHPTGFVYREQAPWTLQAWNARPAFDAKWLPPEVWAERNRMQMLSMDKRDGADDRIDAWWTPDRKFAAALAHVRKVPPKSTGDNSSGTFMRLATVLVRGFILDVPQCRELATFWAREVCGHEPWTRKEIEHKLRQAFDRGAMAWGAKLQDRSRNPDARLEAAEQQVADMIAGRVRRPIVADHVHDLDLVPLPDGFVDEPMATEAPVSANSDDAIEADDVIDALGYGPPGDDLVARGNVLVRERDIETLVNDPEAARAAAKSIVAEQIAEVVDIGVARMVKSQEQGVHGATIEMERDDSDMHTMFDENEEVVTNVATANTSTTAAAPALVAGSQEQLRQVFAQFGIDLADIRKNNELYHTKTDKDGNIIGLDITTNNIALVFTYARAYRGKFRMNMMSEEQEFAGERVTDAMDARLKKNIDGWFAREVPKERVRDAVLLSCDSDRYNPVREYIDGLPEWDGVERWKLMADQVLHVKDNPTHSAVLIEKFGLSAMARALQPGCQAEAMLVLQSSKQGQFKTTFCKTLFGAEFFSNQPLNINDKDSRMLMARNWCIEIGEGEILSTPSKVMAFKAFLSQADDDIRLPYARRLIRMPRRGVFIATTNELRFLHDPTGSRRFWILEIGSKINVKKLVAWRDQLWAEAKHKVLAHIAAEYESPEWIATQWWLTDSEQLTNDAHNAKRQNEDAWEGPLLAFLNDAGRKPFMIGDALEKLQLPAGQRDWVSTRRATDIIRRLGCVPYNDGKTSRVDNRRGRFWEPPKELAGDDDTGGVHSQLAMSPAQAKPAADDNDNDLA